MNEHNFEKKQNQELVRNIPDHKSGILLPHELVEDILELLTNPKKFHYNTNEIVCDWDDVTRVSANLLAILRDQARLKNKE